ncbi:MAG: stage 0 sporulation protein, partial [Clostridia bacterium]|nr:stage 0 sporulation protein [Clostridia bacterium]
MEDKVIGVRFSKAGRVYYFDPDGTETPLGCGVIVETIRGIEYGKVVMGPC